MRAHHLALLLFLGLLLPGGEARATYINPSVTAQNSSNNAIFADVVGNKTDDETNIVAGAGSTASLAAYAYVAEKHAHGLAQVFPASMAGITVTCGADAATYGDASAAIVPANAVTSPFDVHFIIIHNFSANDTYQIQLLDDGTPIGEKRILKTATADPTVSHTLTAPMVAANSEITAKCKSLGGGSDTVTISLNLHAY